MLEWKSRFSCFLWTSLSSGIVLPRGCSAEYLYIVTLLASLIPTYFQFRPLFSIREVIDLHLSLNLHKDEDRECGCASVRISVCLWFPEGLLPLTPHANYYGWHGVWDGKYIHWLLHSMSPVNHTLYTLPYRWIRLFISMHTHTQPQGCKNPASCLVLQSRTDTHNHTWMFCSHLYFSFQIFFSSPRSFNFWQMSLNTLSEASR